MGLVSFDVFFNKRDKKYKPGDTISGRAVLNINSVYKINGISIKYKGRSRTQWTKHSGNRTRQYGGEETYFENIKYFVQANNYSPMVLQPGKHTYDFSYALPAVIPSSFDGSNGDVKYSVKVIVERHMEAHHILKTEFFITQSRDLNLINFIKDPATLSFEREYWSCFKTGIIKCTVKVPCTGFVGDQTVPVILEIKNNSPVKVQGLSLRIKSYVSFYNSNVNCKKLVKSPVLQQHLNVRVPARTSGVYCHNLIIPNTEVVNLDDCKIIKQAHKLKVAAIVSGFNSNVNGELPIVLGHIRLNNITPTENLSSVVPQIVDSSLVREFHY